jgi:hypothetical protein
MIATLEVDVDVDVDIDIDVDVVQKSAERGVGLTRAKFSGGIPAQSWMTRSLATGIPWSPKEDPVLLRRQTLSTDPMSLDRLQDHRLQLLVVEPEGYHSVAQKPPGDVRGFLPVEGAEADQADRYHQYLWMAAMAKIDLKQRKLN